MDSARNSFELRPIHTAIQDFANSIVSIVFFLYFSQWIVIDKGIPDFWLNLTFTITALFLLLTVPITGTYLDKYWRRISGLRYTTVFSAIFYGLSAYFAIIDLAIPSLIMWIFGLYFYLLSFTFYTPLLNDISTKSNRGKISGYGIAVNYSGQLIGLIITLPFSTGYFNLFGGQERAETLLPSVVIFFLLSIPMLLWFKEPLKVFTNRPSFKTEFKNTFNEMKTLFSYRPVLLFMITYFLFNYTVLTAANNFFIFLEQVWKMPDIYKTYILASIIITSIIGGYISGFIADRYGHKKTLMCILIGWVIILPTLALLTNFTILIISTSIMGIWFGASWAVSRSMMGHLAPKNRHNSVFAYFSLVERASGLLGPIIWGSIVSGLISIGSVRYRIATIVITIFVIASIFVLKKIDTDHTTEAKESMLK